MIDEEQQKGLIYTAENELGVSLRGNQKASLIRIHETYLKLLPLKAIKCDGIRRDCKDIEDASRRYLQAIRTPGQLSEAEAKDFYIAKAAVKATVEAYRELAKRCRLLYEGIGKRGRPGYWQKQVYISQMATWFEDVTGKKPRSGTGSVFPRFLSACFYQIVLEGELSESVIKRVVKRYYDPERVAIKKVMEKEKRALIRLKKNK
jgi:hypothetical protein